jgi:methanogenic corrinoid protein MtbC1
MASPQEQHYAETIKQVQDAMLAGLETWTRTFQQALDELSAAEPAREQLIDQGFDFIGKLVNAQLNAQRYFARQLAASGTAVTKSVRAGAAEITQALREGSVL